MTSRLVATAFAGLALCLAGCDNNASTPTSPSAGGALVVTTARTTLRAGDTAPLVVTAGSGAPATGIAWTSTDTSVLSVSPAGVATAIRPGRVTVTATSASASGSTALRVVPDYQGTWAGGVARPQIICSTSSTSPACAPGAVTSGTITLRLTQTGDQVAGALIDSAEPLATVLVVGSVQADDQLALAGRLDTPAGAPTVRVEIATLRGTLDVPLGTLTGSYQLLVDRAPVGGTLQADYRAQSQFRDIRR